MDLHYRKEIGMSWIKGLWTGFTNLLSIPSLLLKLRSIWYGATEITVTKCKQTYEVIASYFPGNEK